MLREVEVRTAVDAFHFLEAKRHTELDVCSGVGIVSELIMVVETIVLCAEAEILMPLHAGFFPFGEPVELGTWLDEELHLHLFKLSHAEDELAGYNLVAEGFADLCYAEGNLHASSLLHVEVVDEDALRRLGTQINGACAVGGAAHLGLKHEVELTDISPVAGSADGADDSFVEDNLLHAIQVDTARSVHYLLEAVMQVVILLLILEDTLVRCTELCFVEAVAETLLSLFYLLLNLILVLRHLLFDEHVGTIALLRVTVVDEWVVEGIHVSACFPSGGVHEDGCVDAHDVLVQEHHRLPPVLLYIVLQLNAVLSVVIDGSQTVVNIT